MYTYKVNPDKSETGFKGYPHVLITIRGVFLALILFCASFLAPYIGCNYQSELKTSMEMRYLLLFLVIYFSINLVDGDDANIENPLFALLKSIFETHYTSLVMNLRLKETKKGHMEWFDIQKISVSELKEFTQDHEILQYIEDKQIPYRDR